MDDLAYKCDIFRVLTSSCCISSTYILLHQQILVKHIIMIQALRLTLPLPRHSRSPGIPDSKWIKPCGCLFQIIGHVENLQCCCIPHKFSHTSICSMKICFLNRLVRMLSKSKQKFFRDSNCLDRFHIRMSFHLYLQIFVPFILLITWIIANWYCYLDKGCLLRIFTYKYEHWSIMHHILFCEYPTVSIELIVVVSLEQSWRVSLQQGSWSSWRSLRFFTSS